MGRRRKWLVALAAIGLAMVAVTGGSAWEILAIAAIVVLAGLLPLLAGVVAQVVLRDRELPSYAAAFLSAAVTALPLVFGSRPSLIIGESWLLGAAGSFALGIPFIMGGAAIVRFFRSRRAGRDGSAPAPGAEA